MRGVFKIDEVLFRELARVRPYRNILKAAFIVSVYFATARGMVHRPALAPLLGPFLAFVLAGFINAAHECIHTSQLQSAAANRWLGLLWCTPVLTNFSNYRYHHLVHHRLTGQKGDTEPAMEFARLSQYLRALSGWSYWKHSLRAIRQIERGKLSPRVETAEQRQQVRFDNRVLIAWLCLSLLCTAFWPRAWILGYWLPLALYPSLLMFFSLPEHYACEKSQDLRCNTRSLRSNRWVQFFLWQANFHAEHHAYPSLPGRSLARLHSLICHNFRYRDASYVIFHYRLLQTLALKGKRSRTDVTFKLASR